MICRSLRQKQRKGSREEGKRDGKEIRTRRKPLSLFFSQRLRSFVSRTRGVRAIIIAPRGEERRGEGGGGKGAALKAPLTHSSHLSNRLSAAQQTNNERHFSHDFWSGGVRRRHRTIFLRGGLFGYKRKSRRQRASLPPSLPRSAGWSACGAWEESATARRDVDLNY